MSTQRYLSRQRAGNLMELTAFQEFALLYGDASHFPLNLGGKWLASP